MRVIKQSATVMDRRDMTNMQKIESAGRLAYKSEEAITSDSALKFVNKIRKAGHWPVLEFAVIHVVVHTTEREISRFLACIRGKDKFLHIDTYDVKGTDDGIVTTLITGSIRALADLLLVQPRNNAVGDTLGWFLEHELPDEFPTKNYSLEVSEGDAVLINLEEPEYVSRLPYDMRLRHFHVAVKFITNRAVTHELVRHRPCAFIQESQRYCRYSSDKFGNEVTFIAPTAFFTDGSVEWTSWKQACKHAEGEYMFLLNERKVSPQAARTVLPNSCKTEIIIFANLVEWLHIKKMRVSPAAEPSMQEVITPVIETLHNSNHLFE